ncbi:MAG: hypothetical protein Q9186_003684 [Xanthomendoza sp. 1 TL-2023]
MSTRSSERFMGTPSPSVQLEWLSYLHPPESNGSNSSVDTVHRPRNRPETPVSLRSLGSLSSNPLRLRNENVQPTRLFSRDAYSGEDASLFPSPRRSSKHSLSKSSRGNDNSVPPRSRKTSALTQESVPLEAVDLKSPHKTDYESDNTSDKENQGPSAEDPRLSFDVSNEEVLSVDEPSRTANRTEGRVLPTASAGPHPSRSIKKWINNLRPQPLRRKRTLTVRKQRWPLDDSPQQQDTMGAQNAKHRRSEDKKIDTFRSTGLVDAVKAVLVERPNGSPTPRKIRRSNPFSKSNRSSRRSDDQARSSVDSNALEIAAFQRTTQRQKTLEELVLSEAGYIADLKVLIHAYFTLLTLAPNVPQHTSTQIQQNVTEILALHEDLLAQIQHIIVEPTVHTVRRDLPSLPKQNRQRSVNSHQITSAITGLVHTARTSIDSARPPCLKGVSTPADTNNVIEVARVFGSMLGRFFVYEEYGAKYELMLREFSTNSKSIPNWHAFERSIEALANSLASSSGSEESVKKGLAFEDLLIKPIQRICKYPLLFEDLLSNTLEIDSVESRAELNKVLWRLRETAEEINRATNDRVTQARIQRSWYLQDLLIIPDVSTAPASLRLLGHAILCGVLYVAYESEKDVCGAYMLCVLYKTHLLLAIQQSDAFRYDIVALISLHGAQVEKADDGRGLRCHTASFAWKLIFEHTQQLHELIFCACSKDEGDAWTEITAQHVDKVSHKPQDETSLLVPLYAFQTLVINPLGPVFGMPGTLTRRLSVQRAATVHARTNGAQVIIRNTTAAKEDKDKEFDSIGRSKSVMTASRVPILAPKRTDRSRMESSLADVWSRDKLPFPGMSTQRDIRASASSMMRKISRASFSSTLSKMSGSTSSFADARSAVSATDLHMIGEGNDGRDLRHEGCQSLPSPSVEDKPIVRTGTVKGVKLSDATNQNGERVVSRVLGQAVRIESTEKGSPRLVRKRRSVPSGLLKGFSPTAILERRA